MYGLGALSYPISTTTTPLPVASVIASAQPVMGRLPATQVAAPVADVQVENQTQGGNAFAGVAPEETVNASAAQLTSASQTTGSIYGFPTLFMAQLLGQDPLDPQAQKLLESYAGGGAFSAVRFGSVGGGVPASAAPATPLDSFLQQLAPQAANNNSDLSAAAANSNNASVTQAVQEELPLFTAAGISLPTQVQTAQPAPAPAPVRKTSAPAYAAAAALTTPAPSAQELLVA